MIPGAWPSTCAFPPSTSTAAYSPCPSHVSLDEAAFTEPLACVLRGQRRADLQPGQTVLVLGSGLTGMLHVDLSRSLGAGRILATDLSEYRLEAARRFGADVTIPAGRRRAGPGAGGQRGTAGRPGDSLHRGPAGVAAGPGVRGPGRHRALLRARLSRVFQSRFR